MKELNIQTNSIAETHVLGEKIGQLVKQHMIILLNGDLGAGKTTLTQGIAKGLGIMRNVTSPTFTILKIYQGRMPLYHIDVYRLEGIDQELGFEELLDDDGLSVIEWSSYQPSLIPDEYLSIEINLLEEDSRLFHFVANGKQYEDLLEDLQ